MVMVQDRTMPRNGKTKRSGAKLTDSSNAGLNGSQDDASVQKALPHEGRWGQGGRRKEGGGGANKGMSCTWPLASN